MLNKNRQQKQFALEKITEIFRIDVQQKIDNFLSNELGNSLEFSSKLTSQQRAYIHDYIKPLGLTSKSHGQNENRKLIVYKRINNTATEFKEIHLSEESREIIQQICKGQKFFHYDKEVDCDSPVQNHFQGSLVGIKLDENLIPSRTKPNNLWMEQQHLPIQNYRQIILDTLEKCSVLIVSGETGSGKSTQVPQFILDDYSKKRKPCRIICTQTRRIATTSIAERVSKERGEPLGESVGYQIRLEGCASRKANLIFTTSGCVLRSLMSNKKEIFKNITHLIIDEIHERDKDTDFMLISVKEQLIHDKNLKVILMSATMDIKLLQNYFNNCPVIEVPGQSFSIAKYYLEDILYYTGYKTKMMNAYYNALKSDGIPLECNKPIDIILDSYTQHLIDEALNDCLKNPDNVEDSLHQIIYLIEGEGMPVDASDSTNRQTGLIISVVYRRFEFIQKFLILGADATRVDSYGKNAVDYAREQNIFDIFISFKNFFNYNKSEDLVSLEKQYLLSAYQKQFNDDDFVDHDLILSMVKGLHSKSGAGAILVFLPGYSDIIELQELLCTSLVPGTYKLFILHSQMNSEDQKAALKLYNERKIILSTNIAQTSITIPDLVFVIDTGKMKMKIYDSITGCSMLRSVWVSKACANQRSGRAGRTQNGVCYRLFSQAKYQSMSTFCIPEFVRVPLTEICLYAKTLDGNTPVEQYLSKGLIPPSRVSLNNAVQKLLVLEVFDENENVTNLGKHLANIPLEVHLGKILLYSIFLQCLDPILTIVAYHSMKEPFLLPKDRGQQIEAYKKRKQFSGNSFSDHMGILRLFSTYTNTQNNTRQLQLLCNKNFLSKSNLEMFQQTRSQIYQSVRKIYNISKQSCNRNSNNWHIVQLCLVAGLYPNIVMVDYDNTKLFSQTEKKLGVHQSSILHTKNTEYLFRDAFEKPRDWVLYFEKSRLSSIGIINYNTLVSSIMISLVCGNSSYHFEHNQPAGANDIFLLQIDDWIQFITTYRDKDYLCQIRQHLRYYFLEFLKRSYKCPPNTEFLNFIDGLKSFLLIEVGSLEYEEIPPQYVSFRQSNGNRFPIKNNINNRYQYNFNHKNIGNNRC